MGLEEMFTINSPSWYEADPAHHGLEPRQAAGRPRGASGRRWCLLGFEK